MNFIEVSYVINLRYLVDVLLEEFILEMDFVGQLADSVLDDQLEFILKIFSFLRMRMKSNSLPV